MTYTETTSGAMVEVSGLRKAYGATTVLDGIDLAVDDGTVLALLGLNGAGKTTDPAPRRPGPPQRPPPRLPHRHRQRLGCLRRPGGLRTRSVYSE